MTRHLPSLAALRVFEAAARHGSFKGAAHELSVSHSAVSHRIKALENELGIELFIRKPRAVALTRAGRAYYPVLREAFDNIADGTELLRGSGTRGTITLQVYSTFAIRWLIPRISSLQQRHPSLRLRLHTSQSDVDFEHEDVDVCVMIGHPSRANLRYSYLFSSQIFPVCSKLTMAAFGSPADPAKLRDVSILQVYPSSTDWWTWLKANDLGNVDPDAGQQFDSYDLAMNSAMQGLGVALGMTPFVNRDLVSGLLHEPFPGRRAQAPGDWYLVCREEKATQADIGTFRQWLLEQVATDPNTRPEGYPAPPARPAGIP